MVVAGCGKAASPQPATASIPKASSPAVVSPKQQAVADATGPATGRIPAGAQSVTIGALRGSRIGTKPPAPATITDPATLRRIASLLDSLPVFPRGALSCPMDTGQGLKLTFGGAGGRTLAVVVADQTGCSTVSITAGGKSLPALAHGSSFVRQVLALTHLRLP
jgi:hypothetical protein